MPTHTRATHGCASTARTSLCAAGDLEPFDRACGFRPTTAGLMDLSGRR
jgi:hypothetical protein